MPIEVTDDLVRRVAALSRIAISPEETREIKKHFEKVLAFVSSFEELDLKGIDPTTFSVEASNVYREDAPAPSLSVEDALRNAPRRKDSYFVVPRIVGDPVGEGA
jgi:aspartyl-tRNA(Asn)/glutamyl-tRNA(Gln) amidotransferase subunit C